MISMKVCLWCAIYTFLMNTENITIKKRTEAKPYSSHTGKEYNIICICWEYICSIKIWPWVNFLEIGSFLLKGNEVVALISPGNQSKSINKRPCLWLLDPIRDTFPYYFIQQSFKPVEDINPSSWPPDQWSILSRGLQNECQCLEKYSG